MSDKLQVESTLIDYLWRHHPECGPIEPETDLIESGQLDSLVLLDLVCALQTHFHLEIQPQDITPLNFRTIRALAAWTVAQLAAADKAA
jgi:acyl carrier protein